jgi:hypothetical protein
MTRRIAFALLASILLLLVAAPGASAATSAQIHRDAGDGVIDGNYTLAEMREANRTASAELREYFGWDEAYRGYLRRLANPDAPPVAVPIDANRNGRIDPVEREAAVERTREIRDEPADSRGPRAARNVDDCEEDDTRIECTNPFAETRDPANEPLADEVLDGDEGGFSPLLLAVIGLPLVIVGFGAWRMYRRRKGSTDGSDAA